MLWAISQNCRSLIANDGPSFDTTKEQTEVTKIKGPEEVYNNMNWGKKNKTEDSRERRPEAERLLLNRQ